MKDHTITGIRSSSQDDSAVILGDVKSLFLPRDGSRQMSGNLNMGTDGSDSMTGNLNMDNNRITNLSPLPTSDT